MESKCRQALLDGVYNVGYATPASVAAATGCTEATAYEVLSATTSPEEYYLLISSSKCREYEMLLQLSLCPSMQDSGISEGAAPRVLAAVSHSFIKLYNEEPSSIWSAIVTKECGEMMVNPTYGMLYARITTDEIRRAMEARNERLQLTDNDLVRYSSELFYAVVDSDARCEAHAEETLPHSCSSTEPLTLIDEPLIKKTALQGISPTVVSSLVIAEDGSLETVHKEVVVSHCAKPKVKTKQKPAACDIMSFVKKRDPN
ncbi:Hypothetical protein GLP15_1525 [Giardia lamblia P15]|uniref:Uncharacterized protein n=1 Tax=Giardia intestinalis (strain P15) TaxID=658858 RepID=E1EYL6_GIAIA|nr:Hypothetical protein GLP15_1525 [Giardia lamblia P15]